MLRLETVEDFERIARALADPDSQPDDFIVRRFGYCKICRAVRGCEGYMDEDCVERCYGGRESGSGHDFYVDGTSGAVLVGIFLTGGHIHSAYRRKVENLHSRKNQTIFFRAALDQHILQAKKERRKAGQMVRRLAKLRSQTS